MIFLITINRKRIKLRKRMNLYSKQTWKILEIYLKKEELLIQITTFKQIIIH